MKKEIFEAQHLVEAKEEAFKKMNMKEEDLIIRICDKSEKENPDMCVIEVYQKDELTQKIKDFLIDIISDMGVNCNIETKTRNDLFYLNILSNIVLLEIFLAHMLLIYSLVHCKILNFFLLLLMYLLRLFVYLLILFHRCLRR